MCVRARARDPRGGRVERSGACARVARGSKSGKSAHATGGVDGLSRATLGRGKQRRIYPPKVITVGPGR